MAITLQLNSYYVSEPIIFVNGTRLYYGYRCNANDIVEYRFKKLSGYTYSEEFSIDDSPITISGLEEGDREDGYHYLRFTADESWEESTLDFTVDVSDKSSFKTVTDSMSAIETVYPSTSANLLIDGESYSLNNSLVPVGQPVEVEAYFSELDFVCDFDKLNASNVGIIESDITSITFGIGYYNTKYSTSLRFHFTMPNNDVTLGADFKLATACEVNTYVDETPYLTTAYGLVGRLLGDFRANNVLNRRPTKSGYTFEGWYTDSELTTQATESTVLPSDGLNLYAKFTAIAPTYTVTFKAGETTVDTVTVTEGTAIPSAEIPEAPSVTGKEFDYWALDGEEFDFDTLITDDIELDAVYKDAEYTVTFKEGEETVKEVKVVYEDTVSYIDPTTMTDSDGKEFMFWADSNDKEFDFNTPITEDTTLTAYYAQAGSAKWLMSLPNCFVGLKSDVAELPIARVADGTKALALSANEGEETAYMFNKATLTWIELQHYSVRI